MTLEDVGRNLKNIRLARGWTRNHAANKALMSHSHLKRLELGQCNFRLETILRIAEKWDVSLSEIFKPPEKGRGRR